MDVLRSSWKRIKSWRCENNAHLDYCVFTDFTKTLFKLHYLWRLAQPIA